MFIHLEKFCAQVRGSDMVNTLGSILKDGSGEPVRTSLKAFCGLLQNGEVNSPVPDRTKKINRYLQRQ